MSTAFNPQASKYLKERGIEKASSFPFDEPVHRARNVAIMLAVKNGTVTADDVHLWLSERMPDVLEELNSKPNSWGAVMRSPKLKFTGRIVESKRVSRHSGSQRVWAYNPTHLQ